MDKRTPSPSAGEVPTTETDSRASSLRRPILKAPFLEESSDKDPYYFEFLQSFKELKEAIDKTFISLKEVIALQDHPFLEKAKRAILDRLTPHRNTLYRHAQYFKRIQRKGFLGQQQGKEKDGKRDSVPE